MSEEVKVEKLKTCFKCNVPQSINEFYRHPQMADGRLGKCKTCTKLDVTTNYHAKLDFYHKYDRKRQQRPERREAKVGYLRKFRRKHPGFSAAHDSKRRARLLQAMPKWVDFNQVKQVYLHCPVGMVVDHVVPLTHDLVCGLHVSWNLQYLTPLENSKKGNNFDIERALS